MFSFYFLIFNILRPKTIDSYQVKTFNSIRFNRISHLNMVDEAMTSTYDLLAVELADKYLRSADLNPKGQTWIAIAGGPGSGKVSHPETNIRTSEIILHYKCMQSTLAAAVSARLGEQSIAIPMDGFHYSRSQLKQIGSDPSKPYSYDELLARRGSPWTFDANGLVESLTKIYNEGVGALPIYSRQKSDPVPNGVKGTNGAS